MAASAVVNLKLLKVPDPSFGGSQLLNTSQVKYRFYGLGYIQDVDFNSMSSWTTKKM